MYDREEHIYLYAKYWYKATDDRVKDLQTIIKNCEGLELNKMETIKIVYNMALDHIVNKENKITEFIDDISPENSWKVGYKHKDNHYDFWIAILYKSLSVLRLQSKSDIDIELGSPKPEIFDILDEGVNHEYDNTKRITS
jgi:hypothetical protein